MYLQALSNFWELYGPLRSANYTFLLEFLQFVLALVGTVVHSAGFIDTVVKWNVATCEIQCTGKPLHEYSIVTSISFCVVTKFRAELWVVVCQSIRERNYRLKKRIIYLGLLVNEIQNSHPKTYLSLVAVVRRYWLLLSCWIWINMYFRECREVWSSVQS